MKLIGQTEQEIIGQVDQANWPCLKGGGQPCPMTVEADVLKALVQVQVSKVTEAVTESHKSEMIDHTCDAPTLPLPSGYINLHLAQSTCLNSLCSLIHAINKNPSIDSLNIQVAEKSREQQTIINNSIYRETIRDKFEACFQLINRKIRSVCERERER